MLLPEQPRSLPRALPSASRILCEERGVPGAELSPLGRRWEDREVLAACGFTVLPALEILSLSLTSWTLSPALAGNA